MTTTIKTAPFEAHAAEYDQWFDNYPEVFASEIKILQDALPVGDIKGIEVGLGTGRFSKALGITDGVEPAEEMRKIALERGIEAQNAPAERLPYKDLQFDFVLMATCISYFNKLESAFKEANRVLKNGGSLIAGFIDKNSVIGKEYEAKRDKSPFYKQAIFYTPERVAEEIKNAGFISLEFTQTLFKKPEEIKKPEQVLSGYGKGSYVVIKALKK